MHAHFATTGLAYELQCSHVCPKIIFKMLPQFQKCNKAQLLCKQALKPPLHFPTYCMRYVPADHFNVWILLLPGLPFSKEGKIFLSSLASLVTSSANKDFMLIKN